MTKTKKPMVFLDVAIGGGPSGRMVFEVLVLFLLLASVFILNSNELYAVMKF